MPVKWEYLYEFCYATFHRKIDRGATPARTQSYFVVTAIAWKGAGDERKLNLDAPGFMWSGLLNGNNQPLPYGARHVHQEFKDMMKKGYIGEPISEGARRRMELAILDALNGEGAEDTWRLVREGAITAALNYGEPVLLPEFDHGGW